MSELSIVPEGALLIQNGVIRESGPSRRVENLAQAREAREIDAGGKVVMPAFVDPDTVLVFPGTDPRLKGTVRVLSRKRLEISATETAGERARAGTLSLGAHTGYAADLRDTVKVLRVHQALQSKPLRIRSIFALHSVSANSAVKWLPAIRSRKLAAIVEFTVGGCEEQTGFSELGPEQLLALAVAAAGLGYAIRIRALGRIHPDLLELAAAAGAITLIAPPIKDHQSLNRLADLGCIHVIPATAALGGNDGPLSVRQAIDEGAAIAFGSAARQNGCFSFNPQFLLYLACTRFGLTCEEAIVATTWNAACSLRMSHVTGSLEPGKPADLIMVDVPDYRELVRRVGHNDVQLVMRAGQTVYRRAALTPD